MKSVGWIVSVVGWLWMTYLTAVLLGGGWLVAGFFIPPLELIIPFVIASEYGVFPWMPFAMMIGGMVLVGVGIAQDEAS